MILRSPFNIPVIINFIIIIIVTTAISLPPFDPSFTPPYCLPSLTSYVELVVVSKPEEIENPYPPLSPFRNLRIEQIIDFTLVVVVINSCTHLVLVCFHFTFVFHASPPIDPHPVSNHPFYRYPFPNPAHPDELSSVLAYLLKQCAPMLYG